MVSEGLQEHFFTDVGILIIFGIVRSCGKIGLHALPGAFGNAVCLSSFTRQLQALGRRRFFLRWHLAIMLTPSCTRLLAVTRICKGHIALHLTKQTQSAFSIIDCLEHLSLSDSRATAQLFSGFIFAHGIWTLRLQVARVRFS